jgi:hypothetical protein
MIAGIFHEGSGVGNQLHRYVATRVSAADKGYDFGMVAPENFKGYSFMNLDMGVEVPCTWTLGAGGEVIPISSMATFKEKKVVENGVDIRGYDPEFDFIKDNTIIDGEFQDRRYFKDRMHQIDRWLAVEPLGLPSDLCVIGFRGGEYTLNPDLFLTKDYWDEAMAIMRKIRPNMRFVAVTDDPQSAASCLPKEVEVRHDVGEDWRMIRYAKYSIIANSSFFILPSLLNSESKKVIAPRYWARRNTGVWATQQNYYRQFHYI